MKFYPDVEEDMDRLRLRPEVRLRTWETTARTIADLVDAPLATLGRELSRSVLVHPGQPLDGATRLVERIQAAHAVTPEQRGPIFDALNALVCAGVDVRVPGDWLPGLTAIEPPFPGRLAAGFAALALGDWRRAASVAPQPYDLTGGLEFRGDVHGLLGYAIWIVRAGASLVATSDALRRLAEELDVLCENGQVDEATVLWIARLAFHTLDKAPVREVAARAHEWLWSAPAGLERARAEPPRFPIGATLGDGAYRIETWLMGTGSKRLYRGVEVATGAQLLVALDYFRSRHDIAQLRAEVDFDAPGLHSLAHVGLFDGRRDLWTVVERAPSGTWLPMLVGPANPWTAPRKAIELGVSAGQILLGARHVHPSYLRDVRPEVMWAEERDGHYAVTGIAPRCFQLFLRSYGDAFTHPLFFHHYRDPQRYDTFDDRELTFSLAVMVTEWTMGVYPLLQKWAQETTDHMPIEAPPKLRALLERGLAPVRCDRPSLSEFVHELHRIG